MKFTLPLPPNMANGRMHWRTKYEAQKSWAARALVAEPQLRGRHDVMPRVVVTAVLYVHQAMDDDNAVARIKWCLDLLVKRGILAGDNRPQCQLAGIPDQFVDRKNPRVELTVEPATAL